MKNLKILLLVAGMQSSLLFATKGGDTISCNTGCCQKNSYAPAGIMIDHVHPKGKFGLAYSFMAIGMNGNLSGTHSISNDAIFNNYMMAPSHMQMQMHMLMPMYGITNKLTAMAMINYSINKMSMNMAPMGMMMNMPGMTMNNPEANMPTSCTSSGLADTKLYLLYNFLGACNHRLVVSAGVSLPTGNINAKGVTMQGSNSILAYNMQLGTGTYNLLPGLVYCGQLNRFTIGAAIQANIKMGVNSRNYCWGNEYSFSPWVAYKLTNWLSASLRGEVYYQNAMYGYDTDINISSGNDPSANVYNYGSRSMLNVLGGLNFSAPKSYLNSMHLLLEYGQPVYQNLQGKTLPNGITQPEFQMAQKYVFTARLQYNF